MDKMSRAEMLAMLDKMKAMLKEPKQPKEIKPTSVGKRYVTIRKVTICRTCGVKKVSVYTLPKGESITVINVSGKIERILWKEVNRPLEVKSYSNCCDHCKEKVKEWQRWYLEEQFLRIINVGLTAVEHRELSTVTTPYEGDVQLPLF